MSIGSHERSRLNAGIIYDALVRAARAGQACPSNSDLCRLIGATSVSTPAHSIARMEKAGKLRVTHEGNGREIHIVELNVTIISKTWSNTTTRERETAQFERTMARIAPPPPPVFRDPCFRCGVRADVGCEHTPDWAKSINQGA
jgi:hypothetical protein